LLFIIALITFLYLVFTFIEVVIGFNRIKNLKNQSIIDHEQLPSISIIFSALNEEDKIEAALTSLMQLDYPRLEVIAVNDRSTDKTPEILERLKQRYPALNVRHIDKLPEGWLGKNHALHTASQHALGDWLLFTDADVLMKKELLLKAISYVLEKKIDHLTIYEHHQRKKFGLKLLLLGSYIGYSIQMKPWRIRHFWSKRSLGHGAFNLVKKSAYQQCGGYETIAMECLDDVKLGELLKANKFRQDVVNAQDYLEKEWYTSLSDMIHGIKKNGFAYYDYHYLPAVRDQLFVFIFFVWPVIAMICYSGPLRWLNAGCVALTLILSTYVAKQFKLQKRYAFFYPISMLLLVYTVGNSIFSTYKNKGITWRGTFYSLSSLKKKKRRVVAS
jgi:glycosyltransferase involved in cell wall biosynthesis